MLKAVTDVYGYMYIYKYEYKCLWSKEINVTDLPVLPPIPHYKYQFCFHDVFHTGKYVSVRGFSVTVNKIFVHVDTHVPH